MSNPESPNSQDAEARRQRLRRVVRELVAAEIADSWKGGGGGGGGGGPVDIPYIEARAKAARRAFNIALKALL